MAEFRYLIVGGGMTGDAACRGIRDRDADGSIGLVGEESHPPYARPPLSKALWQGKDESMRWRGHADLGCAVTMVFPEHGIGARLFPPALADYVTGYYRERGVDVLPGELVQGIEGASVRLGSGRTLEADRIVAGLGIVPSTELAEAAGLP